MVTIKNKKKYNPQKLVLALIFAVIVLASAGLAYKVANREKPLSEPDETKQEINYDPPTEEEKKQAEEHKSRLTEAEETRNNQSQPSASNKASVTPEITSVEVSGGFVELGSYIPGMFENNGNCVAKFTKNAYTVTKQVQSVAEGRTTYCPLIKFPLHEFPEKGIWEITVTYDSSAYTGTSPKRSIEVK